MATRRAGVAVGLLFGLAALVGRAGEIEVRGYAVTINGVTAGEYHMILSRQDDGATAMVGQAELRCQFGPVSYLYTQQISEVWKDGRLVLLDGSTNDDGRRCHVSASVEGPALRLNANGSDARVRRDAWCSTYWRLPDAELRNQPLPLIDADTGRALGATLQHVGTESIRVNGQALPCNHYRLRGHVEVDLWYDARERLVRQDSTNGGRRVVLELLRGGK